MPAPSSALRIALLGCGVVGTQVVRLLTEQAEDLAARVGAPLELVGVAVRDVDAPRDEVVPRALLTTDAADLVTRADIVVELMGGIEPARGLLLRAIEHGASVVTANKALLAQHGPELYQAADAAGVDVYFEAAVAGAIPLVRPLRESLAGDRVRRVLGIVNGTTNYILDEMTTKGLAFDDVLRTAQELGYAEADPTADVEGHDAAAKAAIIASLAFHTRVTLDDVACEGITKVSADDVAWATATGHVIKLLAIAELTDDGVAVRVHPSLVPATHPLATVGGAFNAVFVEAEAAGELMFYGRGAGGAPTASAVVGDVVSVARHRVLGGKGPDESRYADLPLAAADSAVTRYQIRVLVDDRPGVLARVAGVVAERDVSIAAMRQQGETADGGARLVLTTHSAPEAALAATVEAVRALDVVKEVTSVLRVEGA
ncbi:homoserine dehydrogenase [Flavimobilis sp. GY10621]|uniref:Homoserine dehydrogenase n=1 Tax=Flavimobilis rhizosphaerae TaxID=2775421 RepID=A0ABR9DNG4_9MICO|nr:homoserine dehydrogenase [Flavimobilis rhizosphaerae]MBD9698459.1 homoserine dehydrogenase [Flavimobilis rhizosphaerae]